MLEISLALVHLRSTLDGVSRFAVALALSKFYDRMNDCPSFLDLKLNFDETFVASVKVLRKQFRCIFRSTRRCTAERGCRKTHRDRSASSN